jgi:TonB family protein
MPMVEEKARSEQQSRIEGETPQRQRRQMYIALALLLAALVVVLIKDREFWTPPAPEAADTSSDDGTTPTPATSTSPAEINSRSTHRPAKAKQRSEHTVRAATAQPSVPDSGANAAPSGTSIATERAALPPLEVEVVAGGQRTVLQPSNHSVKVDLQSGTPATPVAGTASTPTTPAAVSQPSSVATNVSERVRLSPDTAQMVERPVEPNYPMLAKQMKVQGSVILQALIGREGAIQDLRVLSGPAILSGAAMDAVRQWRFRPYFQSGQPVETEARITVNFTISTY